MATNDRQRTRRVNVSVPDHLLEAARDAGLSPSTVLQDALRTLVSCPHERLACARCGAELRHAAVAEQALGRFYADVQALVLDHARQEGTVIGLARRVRDLGLRYRLRLAHELALPGLTRAERAAAKVKEFPPPSSPAAAALSVVDEASTEAG